jgi:tetratricopeptide (TPR) repeat protein
VAELLERALAERPDDRKLLEQLVEAQRSAGRSEQALSALENFLRRHSDVGLYRVRASVLSELGRDEEAVQDLERASASDPEALPKLVEVLERAIARAEPQRRVPLVLRLIEILEQAGDSERARLRLVDLAADVPNDQAVLSQLAALEARVGNLDGAIDAYSRLAEVVEGPALSQAALAVAELCQRAERAEQARPLLERALESEPSNSEVRAALSAVLQASGAHRELGELTLAQALDLSHSPERVATLRQAGELFLAGDEVEQAVRSLELARSEATDNLEIVVLLARAYSRAGRLEEALAHLGAVLDANKGKRLRTLGAVYEEKANVHLEEGFLTDALGALTKAFEMDPKNARLGMRLGRLALEAEEDELAQRALRAVAIMKTAEVDGPEGARPETKADANYALAVLAQRAGDPRKAKILAAKAVSEDPDHQEARELLAQFDRR